MRKDLPSLSNFLPRKEEPTSDFMKILLTGANIFFNKTLYVVFFLVFVYAVATQSNPFGKGETIYLKLFFGGILVSIYLAKDYLEDEIVIEMETEEKFISLLDVAIFKMNFETKRKLESEGIFEFKPLDWRESILDMSNIHVQLVREGKAVIRGTKDDIKKLQNLLTI